jgi:hypothetical protein
MFDLTKPVQVKPITELTMSRMEPKYISHVCAYLQNVLGCQVEQLASGKTHIRFPQGTVEETYMGQSTQWTHRTLIRFPTGQTLTKYVSVILHNPTQATTMLAFPNEVLEPSVKPPTRLG